MSDREAFYRAAIGPKNQAYYLSRFLAFDEAGRAGPSWNWAAALLTFFWFIYRRMWAVAFAYLVAANLLAWVIGIVYGVVGPLIALVVQIALPGLYGIRRDAKRCLMQAEMAKLERPATLGRLFLATHRAFRFWRIFRVDRSSFDFAHH